MAAIKTVFIRRQEKLISADLLRKGKKWSRVSFKQGDGAHNEIINKVVIVNNKHLA